METTIDAEPMIECWKCGTHLPDEMGIGEEEPIYCGPCRASLILPCDCGGVFDRSGRGMPVCPDCGMRCGYWEDCDLVDPEDREALDAGTFGLPPDIGA